VIAYTHNSPRRLPLSEEARTTILVRMPASRGQGLGYFAFWFSVSISTRAVGPDEAGF
jgi:hypothetical protein